MKYPKKRKCRQARAKAKSTSSCSGFLDPVSAPSSLPGVNDLVAEISSSMSPCSVHLPEVLATHSFISDRLTEQAGPFGGETAKVSVGATTCEHDLVPAQMQ